MTDGPFRFEPALDGTVLAHLYRGEMNRARLAVGERPTGPELMADKGVVASISAARGHRDSL